jgi:integrase
MKVWTADDLADFLDIVAADRLYPLFRLATHTGMRRSELLGLTWGAVNLDSGVVSVARRRVRVGYQMVAREGTKTLSGSRAVDLDPGTVAVLRVWRTEQAAERAAWGSAWNGSAEHVFTREDGTAVHADYLTQRFRRLVRRAGVPAVRFHDLRHTFATLSLAAGEPPHVVAQRLGHASPTITLSIYGHVLPGQGQQAAARFAALVEGGRRSGRGGRRHRCPVDAEAPSDSDISGTAERATDPENGL